MSIQSQIQPERKTTDNYNVICHEIKRNLHDPDQESGYRHYCVLLRSGTNNWKGKDRLRM